MQWAMAQMMMKQLSRADEEEGGVGGGKAFKRIHNLKKRVEKQPRAIINNYLAELSEKLGVEPGDTWQIWMWTERIHWGKMLGLKRVHWHLSHVLTLSLRGEKEQGEA